MSTNVVLEQCDEFVLMWATGYRLVNSKSGANSTHHDDSLGFLLRSAYLNLFLFSLGHYHWSFTYREL